MITDNPSEPFRAIAEVFHTEDGSQWLCEGEEGKANAQFIVTACNSHAALVGALEKMLEAYAPKASETAAINGEVNLHSAARAARAALNLAKGGK